MTFVVVVALPLWKCYYGSTTFVTYYRFRDFITNVNTQAGNIQVDNTYYFNDCVKVAETSTQSSIYSN